MSAASPHPALHDDLKASLAEWGVQLPDTGAQGMALISSGALDSMGLLMLSVWIEEKVGHPIDTGQLDLPAEWDTIDCILRFIARDVGTGVP